MSRTARRVSESGYFHVIIRGNGKQQIFEETNDCRYFLNILEKYSKETGVGICAYCLMGNHVHLLVHDKANVLSLFMQKLEVSYASFFNWKYGRTGHLFQGRFNCDPAEDDSQLLTVFRYILRNPLKAGIGSPAGYPWSSYNLYGKDSFLDDALLRELLNDYEYLEEFVMDPKESGIVETEQKRLSDTAAKQIMRNLIGVESGSIIQSFERNKRDAAIKALLDAGLSERQVSRLTGISRYIIRRIVW